MSCASDDNYHIKSSAIQFHLNLLPLQKIDEDKEDNEETDKMTSEKLMCKIKCDIRLLDITFGIKQCEYAISLMNRANQTNPIPEKEDNEEPEKKDGTEPEKKDNEEPEKKKDEELESDEYEELESDDDEEPEKKDDAEPEQKEFKQLIPDDKLIDIIRQVYKSESEDLREKLIKKTINEVNPEAGALQTWYNWSIL